MMLSLVHPQGKLHQASDQRAGRSQTLHVFSGVKMPDKAAALTFMLYPW